MLCPLSYDTVSAVAKKQQSEFCQVAARKRGRRRRNKLRFPPSLKKKKKEKRKKKIEKKKSQSLLRLKWNSVLLWNRPPIQHRTIYLLIFNSRELQYYLTPPRTLYNNRLLFKSLFFPPKQSVQRMNGLFAPNAIQMFKSKIFIWFIFSSLLFFVC